MSYNQFNKEEFEALSLADAGQRIARELSCLELNAKDEKSARERGDKVEADKFAAMVAANYEDYLDMQASLPRMLVRVVIG